MLCYVVLCKLRTFSRKMKFTFVRYYLHVCRLCNVYVKKVFFSPNPISLRLFGPCILLGCILPLLSYCPVFPCHICSLANALIMKLGHLVDQVRWGLLVYSLLS